MNLIAVQNLLSQMPAPRLPRLPPSPYPTTSYTPSGMAQISASSVISGGVALIFVVGATILIAKFVGQVLASYLRAKLPKDDPFGKLVPKLAVLIAYVWGTYTACSILQSMLPWTRFIFGSLFQLSQFFSTMAGLLQWTVMIIVLLQIRETMRK